MALSPKVQDVQENFFKRSQLLAKTSKPTYERLGQRSEMTTRFPSHMLMRLRHWRVSSVTESKRVKIDARNFE